MNFVTITVAAIFSFCIVNVPNVQANSDVSAFHFGNTDSKSNNCYSSRDCTSARRAHCINGTCKSSRYSSTYQPNSSRRDKCTCKYVNTNIEQVLEVKMDIIEDISQC
eukprot:Pgem_evm1s8457